MIVGVDLGYSSVKFISAKGRGDFPSVTGTQDFPRMDAGTGTSKTIILDAPRAVFVGQWAVDFSRATERRQDREWYKSEMFKDLFLAALSQCTSASRCNFQLVVGLPVQFHSADKDAIKAVLMGEHSVKVHGQQQQRFTVDAVKIMPQGFGCLLSECMNDGGNFSNKEIAGGKVGILDIGGKTTNIVSVSAMRDVAKSTTSVNVGGWNVVSIMRDWLSDNLPSLTLEDHDIAQAVINRSVKNFGQPVDLSEPIDNILKPLAAQIIAEATKRWNGGGNLDLIIVSGGGAYLMGQYLTAHFPQARIAQEPVYAQVVGYFRYGKRVYK